MTMNLDGRNVLVVGLARTGEATAAFLLRRGARVTVTESKSRAELGSKAETWVRRGVTLEAGGHTPAAFLEADLIIPSPGVPRLPEIAAARDRGIPVWSEIELASRFLKGSIVGLTGTNGKSTTTTLLHRILKDAGRPAFLAGNIGTPLISFVDRSRDDHLYVTEISSFQLEYIHAFRARLALVLNLSGNHLDWHGTMDDYAAAKAKLVLGQKAGDAAVLNREDARVWAWKEAAVSDVFAFSGKRPVRRGAFVRDGWVVVRDGGDERRILPVSEIKLPGLHNRENVLAAAAAARLLGIAPSRIRASVRGFRGLEHRLEPVATVGGVSFINDSKATTVDATLKALAGFTRPVVLILGGKDKGSDFRPLRKAVRRGVKAVVLVGSAREKIREALAGTVPLLEAETYPEVVRTARAAAAPGDIVLLAPACTSWDMFRDFEERGRVFKREVRRLARRKG
ncbi:MAG TPA: UDP-N-acetylmuramoyl-L-alanine--D-glutamate ligase [Candidatus Aminicenantes bacterium]|nr:UDP-N-acetylmuramoyl-L-alanine--D-glutamate ligase [Candidatus Aminicenantes bacterium]